MAWQFDIQKLITLRELKNLSRLDCAKAIGKTSRAYGLKEQGRFPFTVHEICDMANQFGIDPRSFFVQKPNGDKKAA